MIRCVILVLKALFSAAMVTELLWCLTLGNYPVAPGPLEKERGQVYNIRFIRFSVLPTGLTDDRKSLSKS